MGSISRRLQVGSWFGIGWIDGALERSDYELSITNDEEISKRHCELVMDGGYVLISDLNSTNGSFVNGVPIKTGHRLKSGDIVMVGRTEMRVAF